MQPENQRGAFANDLVRHRLRNFDQETRSERARPSQIIVAANRAQVMLDAIDETPAIAAFERNFVISADQVTHFSFSRISRVMSTRRFMICYPRNGASMSKSDRTAALATANESLIVTRHRMIEKLRSALHQTDPANPPAGPDDHLSPEPATRAAAVLVPIVRREDDLYLVFIRRLLTRLTSRAIAGRLRSRAAASIPPIPPCSTPLYAKRTKRSVSSRRWSTSWAAFSPL